MTTLTTDETKQNQTPVDLQPSEVQSQMQRDEAVLIDVREPHERQAERIEGSVSVPLNQLDPDALRQEYSDKRLIFHCASGKRSTKASNAMAEGQSEPVHHLAGGLEAWKQAGLPTIESKSGPISMMRQVQLTAGSLVVIGLLLGFFVTPWLYLLSAFVGCGLIYAGASGSCGMAALLANMPWNKPG